MLKDDRKGSLQRVLIFEISESVKTAKSLIDHCTATSSLLSRFYQTRKKKSRGRLPLFDTTTTTYSRLKRSVFQNKFEKYKLNLTAQEKCFSKQVRQIQELNKLC